MSPGIGVSGGGRGIVPYHRPLEKLGTIITFAVVADRDEHFTNYVTVHARAGDTIARICARLGRPDRVHDVAKLNHVRHVYKKLKAGEKIRLPGTMRQKDVVNVLAGDPPPIVKDGYAQYDIVPVPQRKGITRFKGYNPYALDVPVKWEVWKRRFDKDAGHAVETDIVRLEKMAGRGVFPGAGSGPPAVITISVTDHKGTVVPLIPRNFQWMPGSTAPWWRVAGLAWGQQGTLRAGPENPNANGRRLRETCVVSLQEFTPVGIPDWSSTSRSKGKHPQGSGKGKGHHTKGGQGKKAHA